jgi:hypothetical protein
MTRTVSIATMIEQLDGLRDTTDLNDWEQGFVTHVIRIYLCAHKRTSALSGGKVEKIEEIWSKHFA